MINEFQKQERKKFITASEVSGLMGMNPYFSAADIWLRKTGQLPDDEGNENTQRGNLLEPAILEYARQELGTDFQTNIMLSHSGGVLAANFDGINFESRFVVEAKSSRVGGDYGEENTDAVPDAVVCQTHAQMLVAGDDFRIAYVPVITLGLAFRMYVVKRDDDICAEILATASEFMEKYVRPRVRPSDFRPSLETLKRIRREPRTIIDVPSALIDDWVNAKAAAKIADNAVDAAQARLLTAMSQAEAAEDESGRVVTFFSQHRRGYTVGETDYRVLRLRKNAERVEGPKILSE